eukprot:scaffold5164_cov251-Prasinococcus_capsulatus_cf.AAC.2
MYGTSKEGHEAKRASPRCPAAAGCRLAGGCVRSQSCSCYAAPPAAPPPSPPPKGWPTLAAGGGGLRSSLKLCWYMTPPRMQTTMAATPPAEAPSPTAPARKRALSAPLPPAARGVVTLSAARPTTLRQEKPKKEMERPPTQEARTGPKTRGCASVRRPPSWALPKSAARRASPHHVGGHGEHVGGGPRVGAHVELRVEEHVRDGARQDDDERGRGVRVGHRLAHERHLDEGHHDGARRAEDDEGVHVGVLQHLRVGEDGHKANVAVDVSSLFPFADIASPGAHAAGGPTPGGGGRVPVDGVAPFFAPLSNAARGRTDAAAMGERRMRRRPPFVATRQLRAAPHTARAAAGRAPIPPPSHPPSHARTHACVHPINHPSILGGVCAGGCR